MVSCNVYNSIRKYDEKYVDIKNTEEKHKKINKRYNTNYFSNNDFIFL